jgi:hypothetical protein
MLTNLAAPGSKCACCSNVVNNVHHFAEHDVQGCLDKGVCERTFARKDLLKQHVQQIHLATANELVSKSLQVPKARSKTVNITRINNEAQWCGFCRELYSSIPTRLDHVAGHFRNGCDIEDWIPLVIV